MQSRYLAAAVGIVAWTICAVAVWFVLYAVTALVFAVALPSRVESSVMYRPASRAYEQIDVDVFSDVRAGDDIAHAADVVVTLTTSDGTLSTMSIKIRDVDRSVARIVGSDPAAAPGPLDERAVLRWLEDAGIDTADVQVRGEAKELILAIHGLAGGPKGGPPSNLRLLTRKQLHIGPRQLPPAWAWVSWLRLLGAIVLPSFAGLVLFQRISARRVSRAPRRFLE